MSAASPTTAQTPRTTSPTSKPSEGSELWRVENILPGGKPLVEKDWLSNPNPLVAPKFNNVGLTTWEATRLEWRKQTVANLPSPPPPVNYDLLVSGLTQLVRTYELPGRMTLPDIIEVLNDIWECENNGY